MRRIALALASLVSLAAISLVAAPAQAAPPPATQEVGVAGVANNRLVSVRYNECLVVVSGSTADGIPIGHYPCDHPESWQNWSLVSVGDKELCADRVWPWGCARYEHKEVFLLISTLSQKCADPDNGSIDSGATLEQRPCNNDRLQQLWYTQASPNGGIFIFNAKAFDSGQQRVIDVPPFSQDYRVRLWTFNGTTAQEFLVQ